MTESDDAPRRHPQVVNLDELPASIGGKGPRYAFTRKQLGAAAGAQQLGVSYMELPPGARAWPRHFHAANEEGVYILAGRGRVRIGEVEVEVRAGDYVALPAGPAHAHQTINDSDEPLRYLCMSTMLSTDIGVYPDSDKIGVFAGSAPGGAKAGRFVEGFFRMGARVDYWDGEDTGEG
jgi:uncharacterized cupin superfamily protein